MRRLTLALGIVLVPLGACENPVVACNLNALPGIRLSVVDAGTGARVPDANDARAIAREGGFADTSFIVGGDAGLATERAGTYDVRVEYPGYQLWTSSNIVVEPGRCHVQQRQLRAELAPQ